MAHCKLDINHGNSLHIQKWLNISITPYNYAPIAQLVQDVIHSTVVPAFGGWFSRGFGPLLLLLDDGNRGYGCCEFIYDHV